MTKQRPFDADDPRFMKEFEAALRSCNLPMARKGSGYRSSYSQFCLQVAFEVVNRLKLYASPVIQMNENMDHELSLKIIGGDAKSNVLLQDENAELKVLAEKVQILIFDKDDAYCKLQQAVRECLAAQEDEAKAQSAMENAGDNYTVSADYGLLFSLAIGKAYVAEQALRELIKEK